MRPQPQPGHVFRRFGKMNAQANARGFREIRRNIHLNIAVEYSPIVHPPGFTAQKQRVAAIFKDVQGCDHHLVCVLLCLTVQHARGKIVHARRFPALNPGIRIDLRRFTHPNIIVQRRTADVIRQRRHQRFHAISPPLSQVSGCAIELPALLTMRDRQDAVVLR